MGRYRIVRTKEAEKDLAKILKSGNKSDIKKVEIFFSEIEDHPRTGTGLPEQLKYFETNNITEESLLIGRQRSSKMEVLERTELLNHKNVIQQPLENGHSLIMGKAMAGRYRPTTDELRKEENNG